MSLIMMGRRAPRAPSGRPGVFSSRSVTYTPIGGSPITRGYQMFQAASYRPSIPHKTILALPGSGELGTNNTSQMSSALALAVAAGAATWPSNVIFPQWENTDTFGGRTHAFPLIPAIIAQAASEWTVDVDRTYLVGLSLGALIALECLYSYRSLFAGVLVAEGFCSNRVYLISGEPSSITSAAAAAEVAARCTTLPIRHFQSAADTANLPANARETRDAFQAVPSPLYSYSEGAPVTGLDHGSAISAVMNDATQFTWLYSLRRAA
jgi:predicted peptidase